MKLKVRRDKRKKGKESSSKPNCCFVAHMHLTIKKRTTQQFQHCRGKGISQLRNVKSDTQKAWTACTNHFCFFNFFIFVKRMNCPSFKLSITKKPWWKYENKTLAISFDISAFKVNLIFSLCNQSIKRLKTPCTTIVFCF